MTALLLTVYLVVAFLLAFGLAFMGSTKPDTYPPPLVATVWPGLRAGALLVGCVWLTMMALTAGPAWLGRKFAEALTEGDQ